LPYDKKETPLYFRVRGGGGGRKKLKTKKEERKHGPAGRK